MWNEEFKDIQNWIASGQLEPALRKIDNFSQAAAQELGPDLALTSKLLLARFNTLAIERTRGVLSNLDERQESNRLSSDALNYCRILERQLGAGSRPPARSPERVDVTDRTSRTSRTDLEALIRGSQFRKIAWLQRGIAAARSVCKIETPVCTGTGFLLQGSVLVTNNHVLPTKELARSSCAVFNFQLDEWDRPLRSARIDLDPERAFATHQALDCTLVSLMASSSESKEWGFLTVREVPEISRGALVSIIQHPDGAYKQVALLGSVDYVEGDGRIVYQTSTMPGSSGAPVFDEDWKVVALHRGAGSWSPAEQTYSNNVGIRFSSIKENSDLSSLLSRFKLP